MTDELSVDEQQKLQLRITIAKGVKDGILGSVKLKKTNTTAYFIKEKKA